MKATKVLARMVSQEFAATNLTPDTAFALLQEAGVYRGAHALDQKDFSQFQVQQVTGHVDDALTYEFVAKQGVKLPKDKVALLVSAGVVGYKPIPGEHAFVKALDDNDEPTLYPVIVMAEHATELNCAGIYDGEPWSADFAINDVLIPTAYIGKAGLLSVQTFKHYFQIDGATHINIEDLGMVDARLAESNLTYRDMFEYMIVDEDEFDATKFYRKLMKKHKVTRDHDLMHFLKTGEYVERAPAKTSAKPLPQKAQADNGLTAFGEHVMQLRGKQLQDLYAAVCRVGRVKEADRQTTAAKVKAHILEVVTEARLDKLITAGAYEAPAEGSKAA